MELEYTYFNNAVVVRLNHDEGSLEDSDLQSLCRNISQLLNERIDSIALDITPCRFLNSYGLGELISIRNYFSDIHIDCILVTENTKVLKLLDMVGMTDLFTVVPDKTDIPSRV